MQEQSEHREIEIAVVCPSHKRAERVLAKNVVAGLKICVPESQREEYEKHNPECEIVTHPDTVLGLSLKRQWIYEHWGNVFMVDDDVTGFDRVYVEPGEVSAVDPVTAHDIIQFAGNMAGMVGAKLFGFTDKPNPVMYRGFKPWSLTGYVTGCAIGLLEGGKFSFSPKAVAVEDYYISGLNAYFHRRAFIDRRFNFKQKDTFMGVGGLADFRTEESEKQDTLFLRKLFGSAITRKMDTKLAKSKNPYGRTLTIPF